jgi:hypothetical protein
MISSQLTTKLLSVGTWMLMFPYLQNQFANCTKAEDDCDRSFQTKELISAQRENEMSKVQRPTDIRLSFHF